MKLNIYIKLHSQLLPGETDQKMLGFVRHIHLTDKTPEEKRDALVIIFLSFRTKDFMGEKRFEAKHRHRP